MMNILLIDNYDSFTYNLYQYIGAMLEQKKKQFRLTVCRNDEITLQEIEKGQFTHIILSPGPGDVKNKSDVGVCLDVVIHLSKKTPIFGVCLGMQAIAYAFGGKITRAKQPMHGKTSIIDHDRKGVFLGLPQNIVAMRYHSLIVEKESIPKSLEITSLSKDTNEVMGIRHTQYPLEGIQFHPESFATNQGQSLLKNFLFPMAR